MKVSQLRAVTHDLVLNSLTNNVYQANAGFRVLYNAREKHDGGYVISAPVISGDIDDTTGGWYQGAELLASAEKDDITRASVNWKQVQETVFISKADINKAGGKNAVLKLLASKIKIAERRMKSRLAGGVFGGLDALKFDGLQAIIHATADYAGLAIGDIKDEKGADAWKAYIKTATGALTEPLMQFGIGQATQDDERPSAAFMDQLVYNEVWGLLSEHQRIMVKDASFSGAGHDQRKVLMYNGVPHHIDSHMEAQALYYVNTEYTKLHVHSAEDLIAESFSKLENVNAVKERMLLMGNLLCTKRSGNSALKGITVVAV